MTETADLQSLLSVQITLEVRVSGPGGVSYGTLQSLSKESASFIVDQRMGDPKESIDILLPFSVDEEVAIMGEIDRTEQRDKNFFHSMRFTLVEPSMRDTLDLFIEHALSLPGSHTRKHPRIVHRVPVTFKGQVQQIAMLETIAMGGLGLWIDQPLGIGEEARVTIPWPLRSAQKPNSLIVEGRIVNQDPVTTSGKISYRVGVQFGSLEHETQVTLRSFIYDVLGLAESKSRS